MSDTSTNRFVGYGTAAERAAFTPSPATIAAAPKQLYVWYESDTGNFYAYDTSWHFVSGSTTASGPIIPAARLTTETGVPVSTSDRTAQGTIYWTPYNGNQIRLYSGSTWVQFTLTEKSLALTATSGKNYDVFAYNNAGTVTLELSAAWTTDTARADALALQDGVYVKSGATTRLYIGTIRASGANVTADALLTRYVWNAFNRVQVPLSVVDTTNTWTWNSATWHQANASAANQVAYVCGLSQDIVRASVVGMTDGGVGKAGAVGIGVDSTSANSAVVLTEANAGVNSGNWITLANYQGWPGIGYHYLAWLEYARAGTVTFQGDAGLADQQTGLTATTWQ